jgi:hypothetical protein
VQADTVIFDDELSPGQLRNLEKAFSGGRDGAQVRLLMREMLLHSSCISTGVQGF